MDMQNLPIDASHPAVREYLSLVRLQVLTPLSLLINIATVLVCSTLVSPSIRGVAKLYPTSISPNVHALAAYVLLMYLGQTGYCTLLVLARKPETKQAMVKAVGLSLVLANWVMAAWAIAWIFRLLLLCTILQALLLLLLLYSNTALLIYHSPTAARPLDTALIHAPLRFFLVLPLASLFPYSLFVTLHLTYSSTSPGIPPDPSPGAWHAFPGLAAVLATNLLGLAVILLRRDIVWCAAATWTAVALWTERPKPALISIPAMLFTALHPVALLLALLHHRFYARRPRVVLPGSDEAIYRNPNGPSNIEAHGGAQRARAGGEEGEGSVTEGEGAGREVDVEGTWG